MEDHGLLFNAFVFLLAAVAVVPFAQRGGLGSVLGYLVAGVAIGPFGLRLVTNPQDILHFAEFGVVMMLFLIGLELQPATLWRLRRPIVGLGGAQVLLTTGAVAGLAWLAGLSWTVGVAAGMGLALSSTAIALQTLAERNLLRTTAGQMSFSVLLFQDLAVIPMLAIVPLLAVAPGAPEAAAHGSALSGWLRAVMVVGVVSAIVLGGRYALRPVFRFIASTGMREIFTAFSLFLVIGIALLMQAIGLSAALGTFLAGVVLADSEYRHELETDIEPFKGLLLGLFFISVGMSIDFALLLANPLVLVALVLGLVLLKMLVLSALARVFRMAFSQNLLFAFVLSQGGEFAFVLFQFAKGEGALNGAQAGTLTAVVALSMAITPLLMLLRERVLEPRLAGRSAPGQPDTITPEDHQVLIAGFGRFGQMVGRLLAANGVGATVLDHDPDQIALLRRFGFKVFYGDATRMDLLHAAGAEHARLLVLAIDDEERMLTLVHEVKRQWPHLQILSRARNRTHAYDLLRAGVDYVRRETFDTAVVMGREVLTRLGMHPYTAQRRAQVFAKHDEAALRESMQYQGDMDSLISFNARSRRQLELLLRSDRETELEQKDAGWGT